MFVWEVLYLIVGVWNCWFLLCKIRYMSDVDMGMDLFEKEL